MRFYIQKLLFLTLLFPSSNLLAQFHQAVFPDLSGNQLADATVDAFKPDRILSYASGRDTMFGKVYRLQDSINCIYSGHQLYLPMNVDPTTFLYNGGISNGINTEHVFPQSKGAGSSNARADLHHLFPTRTSVNSARGNSPFQEIPDNETTTWYFQDQSTSLLPSSNIDLYSERTANGFEPPEAQKGNIARAMFYFYTIYQKEADDADPNFFESQRPTLCDWHQLDPVDSLEWTRSFLIGKFQEDKPNPFVLDCSLAARIYCPHIAENCNGISTQNEPIFKFENALTVFPNPASDRINIQFSTAEMGAVVFNFYDAFGRKLLSQRQENAHQETTEIELPKTGSNFLILEAVISDFGQQKVVRKKILLLK